MSSDCWRASARTRRLMTPRLIAMSGRLARPAAFGIENCTPRSPADAIASVASAVAMRVFDGTTSVSTAAPPTPTRSTSVTSAPSWAPASAAS